MTSTPPSIEHKQRMPSAFSIGAVRAPAVLTTAGVIAGANAVRSALGPLTPLTLRQPLSTSRSPRACLAEGLRFGVRVPDACKQTMQGSGRSRICRMQIKLGQRNLEI